MPRPRVRSGSSAPAHGPPLSDGRRGSSRRSSEPGRSRPPPSRGRGAGSKISHTIEGALPHPCQHAGTDCASGYRGPTVSQCLTGADPSAAPLCERGWAVDWSEAVGQVQGFQGPVAASLCRSRDGFCRASPCAAPAKVLAPWGSRLASPASLDTANGSYGHQPSPHQHTIVAQHHDATDLAVWNTRRRRGRTTRRRAGSCSPIRMRGCARQDPSAPTQLARSQAGVPVNTFNFQTLASAAGASPETRPRSGFQPALLLAIDQPRQGKVNTGTVTTFHPLHMCLAAERRWRSYDIGGYIPPVGSAGPVVSAGRAVHHPSRPPADRHGLVRRRSGRGRPLRPLARGRRDRTAAGAPRPTRSSCSRSSRASAPTPTACAPAGTP